MNTFVRRYRTRGDDGVALVMVLGIMLVGVIIVATLASVTVFTAERTLTSRVEQQALASADSGIDLVQDMIAGTTYEDLSTMCSIPTVEINDDDVVIDLNYTVRRGEAIVTNVACPLPTDVATLLTVKSTATTEPIVLGGDTVTRTVVSTFVPTLPEGTLDRALFSENTFVMRNNTHLVESEDGLRDAHVYANGGITCSTNEEIEGSVVAAHGDVNLDNTCKIFSDVWASGAVYVTASGATIDGNVYAASTAPTYAVRIANSGAGVTGSVLTNGGIYPQNSKTVNGGGIKGIAYSSAGGLVMENGSTIDGSAYVRTGLNMQNGSEIGHDAIVSAGNITTSNNNNWVRGTAWVSGTIPSAPSFRVNTPTATYAKPNTVRAVPNPPVPAQVFPDAVGYPGTIVVPPREPMERISMSEADIQKWIESGWTRVDGTSYCSGTGPAWIVNNGGAITGPRLIDFSSCPAAVKFDNAMLTLTSDVAMISPKGFESNNDLRVKSADGIEKMLYWIVPADSPGVTWATGPTTSGQLTPSCVAPAGNISISKFQYIDNVSQLIYTPCTFTSQNAIPSSSPDFFKGQVYAGTVAQTNGWDQQMFSMPVPSIATANPGPDDEVAFRLTSRYDVRG